VLAEIRGWIQNPPYGPEGPPLVYQDDGEQEYRFYVSLDVGWTPAPEVTAASPAVTPINTLQKVIQYLRAFNTAQFGGRLTRGVWGGLGTAVVHVEYNAWSKGRAYDSCNYPGTSYETQYLPTG
jgi:hypothetical protein